MQMKIDRSGRKGGKFTGGAGRGALEWIRMEDNPQY